MEREILIRKQCFLCKKIRKPLFVVPKEYNRLSLWLKIVGKEHLLQNMSPEYIRNNARICAMHFNDSYFTSTLKTKLCKYAVPSHIENRNQESPIESFTENSLSLPEVNCKLSEKNNLASSQVERNSDTLMSSRIDPVSLNQVSEKNSFTTVVSSLHSRETSVIKVSEKNSFPTVVSLSQSVETSVNRVSKKNFITIAPSSSKTTSLSKIPDKTVQKTKTMTNLITSGKVKHPPLTPVTLCCRESKEGIAFHKVLQDPKKRKLWISAVKSEKGRPSRITILCSKHFRDHRVTEYQPALKENTMPNTSTSDQQKDVEPFNVMGHQWKKAVPFDHQKVSTEEGISELHASPKKDKFYVKVIWDESVSKINKRMHSVQTGAATSNVGVRKKLKRDKTCSPSDTNPYKRNHSAPLSQKAGKQLVKHARKKLNKYVAYSQYIKNRISNNLPNPSVPLQQATREKPVHIVKETEENLKKDAVCSSHDINQSNHPIQLSQKAGKQLVNHVRKKLKKNISYSQCSIKSRYPTHPPNISVIEGKDIGPLSDSRNNEQIDPSGSVHSFIDFSAETSSAEDISQSDSYCDIMEETIGPVKSHCDNVTKRKNLIDSSTQTTPVEEIRQNVGKTINPVNSHNGIVTERNNLIDSFTQTASTEEIRQDGSYSSIVGKTIDPVNSHTVGNITERKDLIESSTQSVAAEVINQIDPTDIVGEVVSNISHSDKVMEGRADTAYFPKIINVEGGINPLSLQEITELEGPQSYNCIAVIKVPNEWWGMTRTPKFIMCTKWNESFDPIFRVIIENDFNVRIFIKGYECVKERRKVPIENITNLLKEVDCYQICAGINDKFMTDCMGHLECGSDQPFSIWCKGCKKKGKDLMNRYKLHQELCLKQ